MRFTGKVSALAFAAAAASLMAMLPAQAASAEASVLKNYECHDESFCLYSSTNGGGSRIEVGAPGFRALDDVGWNDRTRSVLNDTEENWCLYRDNDFQGNWQLVGPGDAFNLNMHLDRAVSSLQPEPDEGC